MPTLYQAPANKPAKKSIKAHAHARMSPLTAFAVNPSGVRFETQEAEEQVILFLRQHFIVNIPWIVLTAIFLFIPSVLFPLVIRSLPAPLPITYLLIGTLSWYLVTAGFALVSFLHWFFNIYIVTNERVIDIDFQYLLFKRFSQAELERIQDISYTAGGIFATVFHYGNVYVQTAAERPEFEFHQVSRPNDVAQVIIEQIRHEEAEAPGAIA